MIRPFTIESETAPKLSNGIITGRPARIAQPCRYCFYSMVQNGFFALQERHVAPINVKFGTGRHSPVGIVFHVYQKENVGIQPPKLKKFRILASNLTRLQYFYEILSNCTRL